MTREKLAEMGLHQLTHPYHQSQVWELERTIKQLGDIEHEVFYDAETNACEIWSRARVQPIPEEASDLFAFPPNKITSDTSKASCL